MSIVHHYRGAERRKLDQRRRLQSAQAQLELLDTLRQEIHEMSDNGRVLTRPVGDARHDLALVPRDEISSRRRAWRVIGPDEDRFQIAVEDARIADRNAFLVSLVVFGDRVLPRGNRTI